MNERLAGPRAGVVCYLLAHFGAGWSNGAAAATAAFWAAAVYAIVSMCNEPWWP